MYLSESQPASLEVVGSHAVLPTADEIAARAFELYEERGGEPGGDLEDWLRAERELLARYASEEAVTRHYLEQAG